MDNRTGAVLGQQPGNQGRIADIAMDETVAGIVLDAGQIAGISGVSQQVQVHHGLIDFGQPLKQKSRSDEAASASH